MLVYKEISPDNHFQSYIRKYWILDNSISPLQTIAKYALPNTCFTLAFITGNGVLMEYPEGQFKLDAGSYLVGELTTRVSLAVLPYTKAFMVQLNPWAASLLSGLSFHELTDKFARLTAINKKLANSFTPDDFKDDQCFKNAVEKKLRDYLHPTKDSMLIAGCFHHFENQLSGQPVKVTTLAELTGYSMRYLEKRFRQNVGLTPKQFYMILRVRSLIDELAQEKMSLTTLAYQHGFADQAHFNKTYVHMMESLPSKFSQDKYILPFSR